MNRPCIAFKLNYCNGGGNSERVGFCGICQYNVRWFNLYENKARDFWCRHPNYACRRYYEEDFATEDSTHQGESSMLADDGAPEYARV